MWLEKMPSKNIPPLQWWWWSKMVKISSHGIRILKKSPLLNKSEKLADSPFLQLGKPTSGLELAEKRSVAKSFLGLEEFFGLKYCRPRTQMGPLVLIGKGIAFKNRGHWGSRDIILANLLFHVFRRSLQKNNLPVSLCWWFQPPN